MPCFISANRLCKILVQQFVPGCYPVIVEGNLFYYVKCKGDTFHESDHLINPLRSGKGKNKQKQAERNSIKLVPGNLKIYFRVGRGGNTKGVLTVKFAFNECGR